MKSLEKIIFADAMLMSNQIKTPDRLTILMKVIYFRIKRVIDEKDTMKYLEKYFSPYFNIYEFYSMILSIESRLLEMSKRFKAK